MEVALDALLIRTFQAVVATESFVAAADAIHVTQSTISQRINKLEQLIGQRLFERSKGGVKLTVSGAKFEPYARSIMQLLDEAIYQTSLPEEYTGFLSLGCEASLWPELSINWLSQLANELPQTAVRFSIAEPATLSNQMQRGRIDMAVMFVPTVRPGFMVERILEDHLVMVSGIEEHSGVLGEDYIYADWGSEFAIAHSRWFPDLKPSQLVAQVGPALVPYLIENRKTAYLPYRVADDFVEAGQLHFVKSAPELPFPSYAVWTENKPIELIDEALRQLRIAAKNAPWIDLGR